MENFNKCGSCSRKPQPLDQFFSKYGCRRSTCLKCRISKQKHRKPTPPVQVCEKCPKTASFNFPCKTPGIRCVEHMDLGMINVKQKNCEHEGCLKQPCYNLPNEHFGKFCASHKTPEMVNVRERRCEHEGCIKKPFYNSPSENRGRFCKDHKEDGMIDVLSDSCQHEGCNVRASYGLKNDNKKRCCVRHKLDNMISLVKITCLHEGCETSASFNFKGEKERLYCSKHKKDNMISVFGPWCAEPECSIIPVFNLPGTKRGVLCSNHKKDGMEDVKNPRCKTPMCDLHTPNEYCARCTAYIFPDKPSRFKTREMKLKECLTAQYPDKTIVHDKRVECHLYRPDFVFDMGSHTIVIELDENQHRAYDTSCDNKRLMSIFHGLGSRPMVMIRFNPDKYDSTPGCFKKDGQLSGQGKEWKLRTEKLKSRIDFWISSQPEREITMEHLFFDSTNG